MANFFYSIHGMIRIRSNVRLNLPEHFLVKKNNPNFIVREGDFSVEPDVYNVGDRFQGKRNYICDNFNKAKRLPVSMKLSLKNIKGTTELKYTPAYKKFIGIDNILFSILELKLLYNDMRFLHSACLGLNGRGIVIAGWSDIGKTSTTLRLIKHGAEYLTEDSTIIDKKGNGYSFPEAPSISMKLTDFDIPTKKKISLKFKSIVTKFPYTTKIVGAKETIDIPCNRDKIRVDKLFILRHGSKTVLKMPKEVALDSLTMSTEYIHSYLNDPQKLIPAYFYLNGENLDRMKDKQREILESALKHMEVFLLRTTDPKDYEQMILEKIGMGG